MYQVQYTGTVITDFFLWCYICGFGNNVYCSPECLSCLNNNPIGIDILQWNWNELQCIRKYYHMLNQYFYVIALYICTLCPLPWTLTYIWKKSIVFTFLIVHFVACNYLLKLLLPLKNIELSVHMYCLLYTWYFKMVVLSYLKYYKIWIRILIFYILNIHESFVLFIGVTWGPK